MPVNITWDLVGKEKIGVSCPYTRDEYENVDIHYHEHDVHDH